MNNTNITPQLLRDYLLGNAATATQEIIEESYFKDDEIFGKLLIAEDELIKDYVAENLTIDDMRKFKEKYLSSPEGMRKFHFKMKIEEDLIPSFEKYPLPEVRKINIWKSIREIFSIRPVRWAGVAAMTIIIFLIIRPQLFQTPGQLTVIPMSKASPGITDLRFVYQLANEALEYKNPVQFKTRAITSVKNKDSALALSEFDRYAVNLKPESEIYLYIFQSDTFGNLTVLFPGSKYADCANPLIGGSSYRIPSLPNWWTLDQNPGIEEIEITATSKPWIQMEKYIALIDSAGKTPKQYHRIIKELIQIASNDSSGIFYGRNFSFLHKKEGDSK